MGKKKTEIQKLQKLLSPHLPLSRGREPAIILCLKGETPEEAKQRYYEEHPNNQNPSLEFVINMWGTKDVGKPKDEASDLGQQVEIEPPGIHDPELEPPPVEAPKIDPFRTPIMPPRNEDKVSEVSRPAPGAEEPDRRHTVDRLCDEVDDPEKEGRVTRSPRKYRGKWDWMR